MITRIIVTLKPEVDVLWPAPDVCFRVMQNLQRAKINEIAEALVEAGCHSLTDQAEALGLCRSTAWTIVKSQCKATGLTAPTINRVLASPKLPDSVRIRVLGYVREKLAGEYGHSAARRRKFEALLDRNLMDGPRAEVPARRVSSHA